MALNYPIYPEIQGHNYKGCGSMGLSTPAKFVGLAICPDPLSFFEGGVHEILQDLGVKKV